MASDKIFEDPYEIRLAISLLILHTVSFCFSGINSHVTGYLPTKISVSPMDNFKKLAIDLKNKIHVMVSFEPLPGSVVIREIYNAGKS